MGEIYYQKRKRKERQGMKEGGKWKVYKKAKKERLDERFYIISLYSIIYPKSINQEEKEKGKRIYVLKK